VLETWRAPTAGPLLNELALGPGGTVYFTGFRGGVIGRLDPLSHTITEWAVGGSPTGIDVEAATGVSSSGQGRLQRSGSRSGGRASWGG